MLDLAAVHCSAHLQSMTQVDDKLSLTPVPRQYDSAGGSSSQLFGAGAFTQDGQRQRSQVHTHLLLSSSCLSSSHDSAGMVYHSKPAVSAGASIMSMCIKDKLSEALSI